MTGRNGASRTGAKPKSVVMSVRIWPEVEDGYRELADATGLSLAALFANGLELLRADPGTKELIAAWKAYDSAFARITAKKRSRAVAKA
jgi:hypothetical protein